MNYNLRSMRRLIIYILVCVALCACSESNSEVDSTQQKVLFNIEVSAPDTRTALVNEDGKYKAIWKEGDFYIVAQIAEKESSFCTGTVEADTPSIKVVAEFEQTEGSSYRYLVASPTLAVSADCTTLGFPLPSRQSPQGMDTFDGAADVILSEVIEFANQPSDQTVTFNTKRVSAVGKVTVKNVALAEGDAVRSIIFACEHPLAGDVTNVVVEDIVAGNDPLTNSIIESASNTITVMLHEPQTGEFTCFFSCLPATLAAGESYIVTLNTEQNHSFVKQAKIPSDLSFTSGRMTTFTVNMAGIVADAPAVDSANCQILYTSTDGNVVTPNQTDAFGANIVSNTYENGQGVITFDSAVTSVGNYAFYKCRNLTSVTIPNGVTLIGNNAFDECSISSIIIPDGVESIGTDAFIYCHNLTEVHIPQNVITLGGNPFRSCNGLAKFSGKYASADGRLLVQNGNIYSFAQAGLVEYTITEPGVNTIGWELFRDCESLVEVTIPQTITKIDFEAFYNCSSLKSVYCRSTTPPILSSKAFGGNAADRKIYVPASSVEAYKSAQYWSEYADAIVAEGATSGVVDLSVAGTANCYLVNGAGSYKFKSVKGNSLENFSNGYSADVLWESFGTSTTPNVGDLITNVAYKDGYISFSTPATFKSGNASIALRDSSGKILWSWHIWCSAEGWSDQVYPNNAGTMMDRNLGATSATPGDIGAFGLLYQWGRKDPFMGGCVMSESTPVASTGSWDVASSDNMDFAVENPMTFATEWYGGSVAGEGWHTSESEKGLYDPCPVGYRVPDGGANGFWATALGTSGITSAGTELDSANYGRHWTLADGTTAAWYPAVGCRLSGSGALGNVGSDGCYWSASPDPSSSNLAYYLLFNNGYVSPAHDYNRSHGYSVRCVRE